MKHQIGLIGLIIGLIAVGIAVFQNNLRPKVPPPPPPTERSLTELAVEAGKKLVREKVLKEEGADLAAKTSVDERKKPHDAVALAYMGLGFLAIVLGIFSWVKKDHIRISGGAVSLGLVAVAWQYVLIGVTIAILIMVLANLGI